MRVFLTLQLCVSTKAKTNIRLFSEVKPAESETSGGITEEDCSLRNSRMFF